MLKREEVRARNAGKQKQAQHGPTQFALFCEANEYIYMKLYPHLDTVDRISKIAEEFEKSKLKGKASYGV